MSLATLFHFLCDQHVSDINISIIRSLRLFCWITTLVVLFLVRCVLEFRCCWVGEASVLQAEAQLLLFYFTSYVLKIFRTLIYPSSGACGYSVELPHWSYCSWFDVCWRFRVVGLEWYRFCRLKHNSCYFISLLMCSTCWSLQHGYHSNPTKPKLQHTSNQEQYDQSGNSTE